MRGVELVADGIFDDSNLSPELDVTMDGNTISAGTGVFPVDGILAEAVLFGTTCVNIDNTSIVGFSTGFRARPTDSGKSTVEMEGFATTPDSWWMAGGNAQNGTSSGSGTLANGTCTTVSHPAPSADPIIVEELGSDRDQSVPTTVESAPADVPDPNLATLFEETPVAFAPDGPAAAGKTSVPAFGANIGDLPPGASIVIFGAFQVQDYAAGVVEIMNQGQVTGSNFSPVSTDDPDTGDPSDPTSTQVDPGSALPVELVAFSAIVDNAGVVLNWQTASETDNAGFEIEQQSGGLETGSGELVVSDWEMIAFVEGHGTTDSQRSYTYAVSSDLNPGLYRFRLKQIDFDGAFEYSPVVEAVVEVPRQLSLGQNYPNPFNPQTNIDFTVPASGQASLKVYSMLGRQVATLFEGQAESGRLYTRSLSAGDLATGQYVYVLDFEGQKLTRTMLVVK